MRFPMSTSKGLMNKTEFLAQTLPVSSQEWTTYNHVKILFATVLFLKNSNTWVTEFRKSRKRLNAARVWSWGEREGKLTVYVVLTTKATPWQSNWHYKKVLHTEKNVRQKIWNADSWSSLHFWQLTISPSDRPKYKGIIGRHQLQLLALKHMEQTKHAPTSQSYKSIYHRYVES